MNYDWTDLLGNIGVLLILVTYLLLQLERIDSRSLGYSVSNAMGALLILVSLYFKFNLSAFIVEFFWLLISIIGVIRGFRRPRKMEVIQEGDSR